MKKQSSKQNRAEGRWSQNKTGSLALITTVNAPEQGSIAYRTDISPVIFYVLCSPSQASDVKEFQLCDHIWCVSSDVLRCISPNNPLFRNVFSAKGASCPYPQFVEGGRFEAFTCTPGTHTRQPFEVAHHSTWITARPISHAGSQAERG